MRHGPALLAARSDLADAAALAAARCAGCCHRRVSGAALSLLGALLAAANGGAAGGTGAAAGAGGDARRERPLAEALGRRGPELTQGLLAALLAPSPLPRVHKVAALLLELSNLAAQLEQNGGNGGGGAGGGAAAAGGFGGQQPGLQVGSGGGHQAQAWLAATLQALPEGQLAPGEAAAVVRTWGPLLAQHSSRSYVVLRRLRRIVREFAEQHARQ